MSEYNADICFTQDIYCNKRGVSTRYVPPDVPGFNLFFSSESDNIPKAAIYVSDKIQASLLSKASNSHCATCVLNSSLGKILVSSLYSPPSDQSPDEKLNFLFENLDHREIQRLVLCGDLNAHSNVWSNSTSTDRKGEVVESIFLQFNMLVLNDPNSPPTFDSGRGRSWIDVTVAGDRMADKISNWKVLEEETLSFHKLISFDIQTPHEDDLTVKYHFESTDWIQFNTFMQNQFILNNISCSTEVPDKLSLDSLATKITDIFTLTIKSNVKSTKNYSRRKLVPWWSKEIAQLRKLVNKARTKFQSTREQADLKKYKSIRNRYKNKIRNSKAVNFENYCKSEGDPWALVKKLTSTYKPPCIPTLKKECGSYTTDDLDTCNYLLEKWFPDDDLSTESDYHKAVRDHVQSFLREGFECPPPITDYEMNVIESISPLKASGSDLIKGIVLQNLSQENLAVVKNLFSLCLKLGVFPTAWKTGEGSILPKPDRPDSESYKSYRGITLLSVLGKWFEKILLKRLMWTGPGSDGFSRNQLGFIPDHAKMPFAIL